MDMLSTKFIIFNSSIFFYYKGEAEKSFHLIEVLFTSISMNDE